uniref:sensor histidine kinase n=1 Tax=Altererythrobacter segetis TaxID=1104773 RepID=UPI00140B9C31|nr:histidine kinase dimerization/phosphoacceptor domain -containing protein [Altererythrobacter segetis]
MLEARITRSNPAESLALALIHASRAPVLLLDAASKVVGASDSFCTAFGLRPRDMAGRSLAQLGQGEWNVPRLRSLLKTSFAGTAAVDAYEIDLVRAGLPDACIVLNAHRLDYDQEAPLVVLTATDVTTARHELRLKDELIREKQVLLQELQHRVANSLQIIASVLMQSARRVQSEETRVHLRNAHNRVLSIATLQKQLAVASDDKVPLDPYFTGLCDSIGASMIDDDGRIALHAGGDKSEVTANVATSLGLIVTELVINALKHAFPDRNQPGEIAVEYRALGTGFALTVTDNGIGIPASAAPIKPGLGTGIVDALAMQLGATVERTDCAPGMKVAVVRAV